MTRPKWSQPLRGADFNRPPRRMPWSPTAGGRYGGLIEAFGSDQTLKPLGDSLGLDAEEARDLDRLLTRIPMHLEQTMRLKLDGLNQYQIADLIGCRQPSVHH